MRNNILLTLIFSVALLSSHGYAGSKKDTVYVFKNDVAVMQAESTDTGSWAVEKELKDFTGESYLHARSGGSPLVYKIKVEEAGFYAVAIRSNHFKGHLDNDCWIQMNDRTKMKVYSGDNSKKWAWWSTLDYNGQRRPVFYLVPGVNEITLSYRSKGFHIDKIIVFKTTSYTFKYQMPKAYNLQHPETKVGAVTLPDFTISKSNLSNLKKGKFGTLYKKVTTILKKEKDSQKPEVWEEAEKIKAYIDEYAEDSKKEVDTLVEGKKLIKALEMATRLAKEFSGTDYKTHFYDISKTLKADKELKAQVAIEKVCRSFHDKIETLMKAVEHKDIKDLSSTSEAKKVKKEYLSLKKKFPESTAFANAKKTAHLLGLKFE